jgi:hypothetical protein
VVELSAEEAAVQALLREQPATTNALARLLGVEPVWPEAVKGRGVILAAVSEDNAAVMDLLAEYPETTSALAAMLGVQS